MKNNNTNQSAQKNHKFNIVDLSLVIILLVVALGVFLWFDPLDWFEDEDPIQEKTILYTVEIKNMDLYQSNKINVSDSVMLVTDDIDQGVIVEVLKAPSVRWYPDDDSDQMILLRNPTKDTVYVTIELQCLYKEGVGYFVHDTQLFVGNSIDLKFLTFNATGECVSIKVKE